MAFGESCMQCFSIIFTIYFTLVSLCFIGYGAFSTIALIASYNADDLSDDGFIALPSISLFIIGMVLLIVVILGCCGECRKGSCCMETYAAFLLVLALVQLGLGIFYLVEGNSTDEKAHIQALAATSVAGRNIYGECCGNEPSEHMVKHICCTKECSENMMLYTAYCALDVANFTLGTNYVIGLSMIIVAITEILAGGLSICLSCAFWRGTREITW